jgi:NAD(P)-dependent dehydrogenase (short-subunit alcohol dehydrogenase family)
MTLQWAVVAGASGALGAAISDVLRQRDLRVLGIARTSDPSMEIVGADLTDPDAVGAVTAQIDGRVKAIVHAAGPALSGGVGDVDPSDVVAAVDVKVGGLLRLVHALDDKLDEGARIIAITGHLGYDPIPASVSAGVANAGLAALVRQLAAAYGPRGVTCHGIAPGPVESPRIDQLIQQIASGSGATADQVRDQLIAEAPFRRFAQPEDVAWAVELLLDDSASLMNGSTLFLDGGRRTAIP